MRLLCRYAGGLACLVTALALVACGGGPGSQPEPKQIDDSTLEIGKSLEISLGDKFSGSDLTFSAATSNRSVATVTVDDNDTLTVTAVGPGEAKITVTAKNSRGEAKQTFTVTVPEPPASDPDPDTDPVNIEDFTFDQGETIHTIPLADKFSGGNLTFSADTSNRSVATVTVDDTTDILTVTAVGPGTARITVTARNSQGSARQTFTVTVPRPADADDEDEEEEVPAVRQGATDEVTVAVEATATVPLSTVFDGAISYTATSSATTIATESVSASGNLTITGVSQGSATITVTGTNTAGSTEHPIAVTVTPAPVTPPPETPPPPTSSTLTIERGESVTRTLPAGQTLEEPPGDGVTVHRNPDPDETENQWIITAKKKGIHKVTVLSAGKAVSTITITVPNSRPVHTDPRANGVPLGNLKITITANADTVDLTVDGQAGSTSINAYFEDADTDDIRYRIEDKPSWFLVDTRDGFVEGAINDGDDNPADTARLTYEILQRVVPSNTDNPEFTVTLYASDGEEEATRPVFIEFDVDATPIQPRALTYDVDQDASGNFRDGNKDGSYNNRLDIGPRREVPHTVIFKKEEAGAFSRFVFAENAYEDIPSEDRPTGDQLTTAGDLSVFYRDARNANKIANTGAEATIPSGYQLPGTRYFLIRGSNAVVVEGGTTGSINLNDTTEPAGARVSFSLKGGSGSGSIIIDYKVWLNKKLVERDHDTDNDPTTPDVPAMVTATTKPATKTLTINVVTCSSPPDPIDACEKGDDS